MTTPPRF